MTRCDEVTPLTRLVNKKEKDHPDDNDSCFDEQKRLNEIIGAFDAAVKEFRSKHDIETQSQWYACLEYVYHTVFREHREWLTEGSVWRTCRSSGTLNYRLLYDLAEYYIFVSHTLNMWANLYGFSVLTGLSYEHFFSWRHKQDTLPEAYRLYMRLRKESEQSLENLMLESKKPVGYLFALNHYFRWKDPEAESISASIDRGIDEIIDEYNSERNEENET